MRRSLLFAALFLCASFVSCQCADKPDVGPVEEEEGGSQTTQVETPPLPPVT